MLQGESRDTFNVPAHDQAGRVWLCNLRATCEGDQGELMMVLGYRSQNSMQLQTDPAGPIKKCGHGGLACNKA
jgi:hypothetical protein